MRVLAGGAARGRRLRGRARDRGRRDCVPGNAPWGARRQVGGGRVPVRRGRGGAARRVARGCPLVRARPDRRRRRRLRARARVAAGGAAGDVRGGRLPRRRDPRPGHGRAGRGEGPDRGRGDLGRARRRALRAPRVHRHGLAALALAAPRPGDRERYAVACRGRLAASSGRCPGGPRARSSHCRPT